MSESIKKVWDDNLSEEVDFWDEHFSSFGSYYDASNREISDLFLRAFIKDSNISILDVGAGPVPYLGELFNGEVIANFLATDPLADEYAKLLDKHSISVRNKVVKLDFCDTLAVEQLLSGRKFDIVYSRNALDHSYSPILAIENMLLCLSERSVMTVSVFIDEGMQSKYEGLHQWDFNVDINRGIMVSNSDKSTVFYLQDMIDKMSAQLSSKFHIRYTFSPSFVFGSEVTTTKTLFFVVFKNYSENEVDIHYNRMQKLELDKTSLFCSEVQRRLIKMRDKVRNSPLGILKRISNKLSNNFEIKNKLMPVGSTQREIAERTIKVVETIYYSGKSLYEKIKLKFNL